MPATAKGYYRPSLQAISLPFHIENLKVTVQFDGTVVIDRNFCCAHFKLLVWAQDSLLSRANGLLY